MALLHYSECCLAKFVRWKVPGLAFEELSNRCALWIGNLIAIALKNRRENPSERLCVHFTACEQTEAFINVHRIQWSHTYVTSSIIAGRGIQIDT